MNKDNLLKEGGERREGLKEVPLSSKGQLPTNLSCDLKFKELIVSSNLFDESQKNFLINALDEFANSGKKFSQVYCLDIWMPEILTIVSKLGWQFKSCYYNSDRKLVGLILEYKKMKENQEGAKIKELLIPVDCERYPLCKHCPWDKNNLCETYSAKLKGTKR